MALCAGAGGLELGLRIALGDDYRCVVYVEREAYAAATLVARMADQALDNAPIWDDITTFDGEPWCGVVDLVSAGFSCQPWSPAGRRLGIDDERWLWPDLDRVICEVGPEWVFVENVPGLVHGGLEHVLRDLAEAGFDAEWDCVSASEVGAPQLRQRLYILAHRTSGVGQTDAAGLRGGQVSGSIRAGQSWPVGTSETVADTNRAGLGGLGSIVLPVDWEAALRDDADGRERPSAVVDHSHAGRRQRKNDEIRSGRSRPERPGLVMGDSESAKRRPPFGVGVCRDEGPHSEGQKTGRTRSAGEQLGEPNCSRLPGTASTRQERFAADAGYWPPDRTHRGAWSPGFEPAIRRVADGMAPWVDRLRLTGNGVVPLAAAVAFLRLRDRLMSAA